MAYFIMLSKLTADGRRTLMKNHGRIWEVNKEVESMGAKILTQYALLGGFDFITILDAANNEVIARVASNLGSRGTLEPTTFSALTVENLVRELNTAKAMRKD
jgi:uncharacterized protein with GYD domain